MIVLQTIAVAFAMFSAVPVPQFDWNAKNMRYAMCAFPLVGLLCGALWCVCGALPLPALVKAAGFCLIPVWVTGGIHLDGYADTCDALSSYGGRAKKLEILKDPHCGAFAVIRLCSYFAAYFALSGCVVFSPRIGLLWTLALMLERALSGLAVASFPLAKDTGLAHTFATAADRVTVRRVLTVLAVLLGGGMLSGLMKHSRMDRAQQQLAELGRALERFNRELKDVRVQCSASAELSGFWRVADLVWDGFISDWTVLSKISDAKERVERTDEQLMQALDQLQQTRRRVLEQINQA